MLRLVVVICTIIASCSTAYSWSSMYTFKGWGTHQFLNRKAYRELSRHPAFKYSGFPRLIDIQEHGSIAYDKTGLGPDVAGNSRFSEHWYNPVNKQGNTPITVQQLHEQFVEAMKEPWPHTLRAEGEIRADKAHLAAYSAHYIQDMTCPMHITGKLGLYVNGDRPGTRKDISPYASLYSKKEWRTLYERYLASQDGYTDFFDPLYYNGNSLFYTIGSSHFSYETHVETRYHLESQVTQYNRWSELENNLGYIPKLYEKVNKDMAQLARETAAETHSQIGTADKPGRLWVDITSENSILESLKVPYDDWWRGIQLTYVLWRSTFSAMHIARDNLKLVKVPNKPGLYQLHIAVENLEPQSKVKDVNVGFTIKGTINKSGTLDIPGAIEAGKVSAWHVVSSQFSIEDIRKRSGTITLEISGHYDSGIPDAEFKIFQYDLSDIEYEAVRVPRVVGEQKERGVRILEGDPYYFKVKTVSAGTPKTRLEDNTIIQQKPLPGSWAAHNEHVELTIFDKYEELDLFADEPPKDEADTSAEKDSEANFAQTTEDNDVSTVPDVEKKSVNDAKKILDGVGIGYHFKGGDPAPTKDLSRYVQEQSPKGGQPLPESKSVALTIYSDVNVPDVLEMPREKALKTLNDAGFAMVSEEGEPAPEARLSLCAQKQIPPGKTPGKDVERVRVRFYQENTKELVTPSILHLTLEQAAGVLSEGGLELDTTVEWGERAASKEQVGTINAQKPGKGEPIEPGGKVTAWIYYTVVPELIKKPFDKAIKTIDAAWFTHAWEWGQTVKNEKLWNCIESQSLEGGKKVKEAGLTISLEVFKEPEKKANPYHALVGHWRGYNQKKNSKSKVLIYLDIVSVSTSGKIKGEFVIPAQEVQLHNPSNQTMKLKKRVLPVTGSVSKKELTLSYKIGGGKGQSKGRWDVKNNTIKGENFISAKALKGGAWHSNGVFFTLKKQ